MVDTQVRPSDVTKFPIIDAMLSVPRHLLVPANKRDVAYADTNITVGPDRIILSPRSFAKLLDAVDIQRGDVVLVIGAAAGYSSAVLARMAEAVIAIDEDPALVKQAEENLAGQGTDNVVVLEGQLHEGAPKHGPYDVILIEGAVETVPDSLLAQLKDGGRIAAIFATAHLGECQIGLMSNEQVTWRKAFHAAAPVLPGFGSEEGFTF